jgi:hypothetical protein
MVTGKPPLKHMSPQRAALLVAAQKRLPLNTETTTLPTNLPEGLRRLIGDCLLPVARARPKASAALEVRRGALDEAFCCAGGDVGWVLRRQLGA